RRGTETASEELSVALMPRTVIVMPAFLDQRVAGERSGEVGSEPLIPSVLRRAAAIASAGPREWGGDPRLCRPTNFVARHASRTPDGSVRPVGIARPWEDRLRRPPPD